MSRLIASLLATVFLCAVSLASAQSTAPEPLRNKVAIERALAAWKDGTGSPYDLLADDAVWTIVGRSLASKTYDSREGFMRDVIRPFNARMSAGLKPQVRHVYADGDTVIAFFDASGVARDGQPYENTYAWFLTMREGRISDRRVSIGLLSMDEQVGHAGNTILGPRPAGTMPRRGYTHRPCAREGAREVRMTGEAGSAPGERPSPPGVDVARIVRPSELSDEELAAWRATQATHEALDRPFFAPEWFGALDDAGHSVEPAQQLCQVHRGAAADSNDHVWAHLVENPQSGAQVLGYRVGLELTPAHHLSVETQRCEHP